MTPPHDTTPDTSPEEYFRQTRIATLSLILAAVTGAPAGRTAAVAIQLATLAEDRMKLVAVAGELIGLVVTHLEHQHGPDAATYVLDQLSALSAAGGKP
jgi:hypothetical protein